MARSRRKSRELSRADTRRQLGTLKRVKRDLSVDTTRGGMPWPPRSEPVWTCPVCGATVRDRDVKQPPAPVHEHGQAVELVYSAGKP
jgi:hypothetical protein